MPAFCGVLFSLTFSRLFRQPHLSGYEPPGCQILKRTSRRWKSVIA
jgi:hypothetical protein